jgi:protein-S-isoprenylcysteine O-methyltransferase Ste14
VELAGLAPVAIGLALALSAARLFRRAATPIEPWETPSALVAAGPYRFTRNPMYLGLALCLSGFAVWLGTLTPFLVIPLFAWVITVRFIRREEQRLETRFGDQYRAYKARVRRWI